MKLAAIQFSPKEGDVDNNLKRIERLVDKIAGAQLIVLPEICDIGYDLNKIKLLAQPFPNQSTDKLSELSRLYDVIIVAGLAEKRDDGIYNTAVVFDRKGKMIAKYDKTHLCPIPPIYEPAVFKAGSKILVGNLPGVKLGLTICYDIRFPEVYRRLALDGAEIIVHPTAFPRMRIEQLEMCLRARAIENQLFLISANHCGFNGGIELGGRSMIVGPDGDIRAKASETKEEIITATIDLGDITRSRKERPVFTQRRPELYQPNNFRKRRKTCL